MEKNRIEDALKFRLSFFGSPHKRVMKVVKTERSSLTSEEVMSVLKRVNRMNPKLRERDVFDECFSWLVPVFENYPQALTFLNVYGFLTEAYIDQYAEPEASLDFQLKLCSISDDSCHKIRYGNLLFYYLRHHDLSEQLKQQLFGQEEYARVLSLYNLLKN